jgi:hypothetical protein
MQTVDSSTMADTCNAYEVSCRFHSDSNGSASCCHKIPCILPFCHEEACPPRSQQFPQLESYKDLTRALKEQNSSDCKKQWKQLNACFAMETPMLRFCSRRGVGVEAISATRPVTREPASAPAVVSSHAHSSLHLTRHRKR